jgi:RNA-splicing ligase RtcB
MFELFGKYGSAVVYVSEIDDATTKQIINILNHPIAENANIRIMPDCHYGTGCVVGFTAKRTNKVVPNLIGVDKGCRISTFCVGNIFDLANKLVLNDWHNHIVRGIPHGMNVREKPYNIKTVYNLFLNHFSLSYETFMNELSEVCGKQGQNFDRVVLSLGTLGGGNHFIELGVDEGNSVWQTFHSGSRNFGKRSCEYHQAKAKAICGPMGNLEYLMGDDLDEYYYDLMIAQEYSKLNSFIMAYEMINYYFGLNIKEIHMVESTHNYVDFTDDIIRKGAISAHEGEEVVIPFNMADGMVIGLGKGNPDWNYSAPHGSGRIGSRGDAKRNFKMEDFEKAMKDAGVQSNCIVQGTIDESPMAYKDTDTIINLLQDTVQVTNRIRPLFSFKSVEKDRREWKKMQKET